MVALKASLEIGGGVTGDNDQGLWLLDSSGSGVLVAREGEMLSGRTIAGVSFIGNSGGNDGRPSGFNDEGQLAFQATFTNGDNGLFLFTHFAADFDGDGDVDSMDLTHPTLGWEARYGVDLDGDDFLLWQQQFGSGVQALSAAAAVPGPVASMMAMFLACTAACFRRHLRTSLANRD